MVAMTVTKSEWTSGYLDLQRFAAFQIYNVLGVGQMGSKQGYFFSYRTRKNIQEPENKSDVSYYNENLKNTKSNL